VATLGTERIRPAHREHYHWRLVLRSAVAGANHAGVRGDWARLVGPAGGCWGTVVFRKGAVNQTGAALDRRPGILLSALPHSSRLALSVRRIVIGIFCRS